MKTLIIDISSIIKGLDTVKPFLYPLIENQESVRIISVPIKAGEKRKFQEKVLREAVKELRRDPPGSWQIIFCICLEGVDLDARSPFRGWLFEQLYLVQKIIRKITDMAEQKPPDDIFVIGLDTIARKEYEDHGPENNALRDIWELDNLGYIRDSKTIGLSKYVFTEKELKTLSGCWPEELCGELKTKGLTDGGIKEIKNDSQCQWLENDIYCCREDIEACFRDQIEKKVKAVANLSDHELKGLLKERLENFRDHFLHELNEHINQKIEPFTREHPIETLLKKTIREKFSINADVSEGVTFLRFKLDGLRGTTLNQREYAKSLLKLAYLLFFLCENTKTLHQKIVNANSDLETESNFWHVGKVEIETGAFTKVLSLYSHKLAERQRFIENELSSVIFEKIPIIKDVCVCGKDNIEDADLVLDRAAIKKRTEWTGYRDTKIGTTLDNYRDEISGIVEDCRDTMLARVGGKKGNEKIELEAIITEFRNERKRLRHELEGEKLKKIEHDWPNVIKEEDTKIMDLFAINPTRSQAISTIFLGLSFILIPFAFEVWIKTRPPDNVFWKNIYTFIFIPGISVGAAMSVHVILSRIWRSDLDKLLKSIGISAEKVAHELKKIKRFNQNYIRKLCELYMASRNLITARETLMHHNTEREYMECDKDRVIKHRKNIAGFIGEIAETGGENPDENSNPEDTASLLPVVECKRPAHQLKVFWPAQFSEEETNYEFNCAGSKETLKSEHLPGLTAMVVDRDQSYNWRKNKC